MKVPAFGWPPRFFNQGAQYAAIIAGDGTVFSKSPSIESITRTGPGVYDVVLAKPAQFPGLVLLAAVNQIGFYTELQTSETAVTISTFDQAGAPADRDMAFILYSLPESWKLIP
jgi:hypothetical protein